MLRGIVKPITAKQAVMRANSIVALERSIYKLGAGGTNPLALVPFSTVDDIYGCDCIGFVMWCLGADRFQPENSDPEHFDTYGGWINTDSALMDAADKRQFFEFTDQPRAGDIVVFPSITKNGKRIRIGHVGLIDEVTTDVARWTSHLWVRPTKDRAAFLNHIKVIDCAGAVRRKIAGRAVQHTTAAGSWNKPDARFLRYTKQAMDVDRLGSLLVNGSRVG